MASRPEDQLAIVRVLKEQTDTLRRENAALKQGGGGGTSDEMIPIKEYVDARDDAVESRLSQKLDKLSTKGTIWAAVATGVGITLAALAFGGDRFDAGMEVSPQLQEMNASYATTDNRQDAQITAMNAKLDVIINQTAKLDQPKR